jgi:hypothetical protein
MTSLTPILGWIPHVEVLAALLLVGKYRKKLEANERSRKKLGHLWKKYKRGYRPRYRTCAHCQDRARSYNSWTQQHVPFLCRPCLEELHAAKLSVGEPIAKIEYDPFLKSGRYSRLRKSKPLIGYEPPINQPLDLEDRDLYRMAMKLAEEVLNERQTVVLGLWIIGNGWTDIGRLLNMGKERVRQILGNSIRKMSRRWDYLQRTHRLEVTQKFIERLKEKACS